ncbi:site-specific integrase [Paraburkholderia sp. DGU8]|uniref:site-specific integrase n=1 Tax=Paraburkholderia sp. DGU8 TaxID=3161997 RepID=UPI00346527D6
MATITHRPENALSRRWQAKVRRKGFPAQSKAFPNKAEAEAWARELEAEYDKGHTIDHKDARETVLRDVLKRYLDEVVPTHKGHEPEGYVVRRLMRAPFASYALANITRAAVTEYRDTRLREVTGSTVRVELNLLARVIETARRDWGVYLAANPIRSIRLPKENAARERRLLPGEEERLLIECEAARAPYLKAAVIVAIETGMRQSEMLALTWERIDFEKRVARLTDTKNGDARAVPLTRRAVAALEGMKQVRVYEWTKHTADGPFRWVGATVIRHAFMRARDKAGMPDLRFHDLRHEATSRLFEKGLNTMEVASVTGHKTLTMLRRYSHLSMDHLLAKLG